jgi:hypothetical protein
VLMAQRDALKRERIAREKAEAEAARKAKLLAQCPLHTFGQASELRAQLMLQGGSTVLQAVETLIEAGVLSVRQGALVVKKTSDKTELVKVAGSELATPRQTPGDSEREVIRGKVRELVALGFRDGAIAKQLGIPASTVYNIRQRVTYAA